MGGAIIDRSPKNPKPLQLGNNVIAFCTALGPIARAHEDSGDFRGWR
jgi:hypothetical protein